MTDNGPWPEMIGKAEGDGGRNYYLVPLDDYQMVNLLGMLGREVSSRHHNGDWLYEIASVIGETIKKYNIKQINNYGDLVDSDFVEKIYNGESIETEGEKLS